MLGFLFTSKITVTLSLAVILWLPQVLTETTSDDHHVIDKRNVGVLARTGQLPYRQGKRYVASLARTGNLPLYIQKKLHPGMTSRNQNPDETLDPNEKRYIGTLVRNGNPTFQFQTKRESIEAQADDVDKLRALEAETRALESVLYLESQLNLELLKEKLQDGVFNNENPDGAEAEMGEEKRSMSSLARTGNLPLKSGDEKRSVEALARAGYLPATPKTLAARNDNAEEEKRSVSALAKNGNLKGYQDGKRGGIGSLARNNLLPQKKDEDNLRDLEELIQEMIDEDKEKRNIGSLARGFNLPSTGKRNLGSLARGGGYSRYAKNGMQDEFTGQDDKRNLASLARSRATPLHEGKRYLGSLVRNQNIPFNKNVYDEVKRTSPMALNRHWNLQQPDNLGTFGKRYYPDSFIDNEEANVQDIAKRYVAALLRQGPLPVGSDENNETPESETKDTAATEEKRHLGSLKASVSKRSIESQTTDNHGKVIGGRSKREAYLMPSSEEYPMPNVQNAELFDYDDLMEVMSGGAAPEKRFLGSVARSGWFRDSNHGQRSGLVDMGKRHIGALARLGWLPQLRSSRYRRHGRAISSRCKRSTRYEREDSTDGSTAEGDAPFWTQTSLFEGRPLLDDVYTDAHVDPLWKRYLLLPAVDNIILRKLYSRHLIH